MAYKLHVCTKTCAFVPVPRVVRCIGRPTVLHLILNIKPNESSSSIFVFLASFWSVCTCSMGTFSVLTLSTTTSVRGGALEHIPYSRYQSTIKLTGGEVLIALIILF